MSRKHNCPKRGMRAKSRYRQRLERRGLKNSPPMEDLDTLRRRQERRPRPWAEDGDQAPELTFDELAAMAPQPRRRP